VTGNDLSNRDGAVVAVHPLSIVVSTHDSRFGAVSFAGDVTTRIAQLAAMGFDGVELAIRDPALVEVDALLEVLELHRMTVPAVGTGQAYIEEGLLLSSAVPETRRATLERILSHLPFAARVDALLIIGMIATATCDGQSVERAREHLVSGLRAIAAEANAQGVRIAIEPINRYESELVRTVDEGLRLLAEVGADNVGLLVDTFHMNIEERSIAESLARSGPHLLHVHLADSNRWHPGGGHIDFSSILQSLDASGYDGFLSGEFLPEPSPAESAQRYLDQMTLLTHGHV
jgi:sugar phosphate isomerase/epimerase